MLSRLASLESVLYEVSLLPCSALGYSGTVHTCLENYFLHEVMSLSWTSFVTFDFPVSRLTCRTSRKRHVAYV